MGTIPGLILGVYYLNAYRVAVVMIYQTYRINAVGSIILYFKAESAYGILRVKSDICYSKAVNVNTGV